MAALAVGWTSPDAAGDLCPSPDAVEYGLSAVALARLERPEVRVGEIAAPPRYPFGYPLLAAPVVRWGAGAGGLQPHSAVLASAAAGAVLVGCVALAGWQAFGAPSGIVGAILVLASPFYVTYTRLVMSEVPSGALLAALAALLASASGARPSSSGREAARWGAGLGLVLAGAVSVRLGNLQALPAVVCGLLYARPCRRPGALAGLAVGLGVGMVPLLTYNALVYGGPLTTGYHLWTPEWMDGARPQFSPRHALSLPALPAGAVQGNLAHYVAAWVGWPAAGDGGQGVASPVHPTVAGGLAAGAGLALWRHRPFPGRRAGREVPDSPPTGGCPAGAVVAFAWAGVLSALTFYALYSYQDVRFLVPWVPMWLLLGGVGLLETIDRGWGTARRRGQTGQVPSGWCVLVYRLAAAGGVAVLLMALASAPAAVIASPLWQRVVGGHTQGPSPRLSQAQVLARELPDDAWLISAIDGPLLEHHVLRGTARRYVPLARGLEFVDKPPLRAVLSAAELAPAIAERLARVGGTPEPAPLTRDGVISGAVVIDRWSLEFAEGLADYRRELEGVLAGANLVPGGVGAPSHPAFYVLTSPAPDHGLGRYALREHEALRDSAGRVYVYGAGERRHVPSIDAFIAQGRRWEEVRRLPDVVLATIPEGPPLTEPVEG